MKGKGDKKVAKIATRKDALEDQTRKLNEEFKNYDLERKGYLDIREIKNALRREYLAKRRALLHEERIISDSTICRIVLENDFFQNPNGK